MENKSQLPRDEHALTEHQTMQDTLQDTVPGTVQSAASANDTVHIPSRDRTEVMDVMRARTVQFDVWGATDVGKVRDQNEDHFFVVRRQREREVLSTNLASGMLRTSDEPTYILAVADGLGGHSSGELASRLALTAGWQGGNSRLSWLLDLAEREPSEFTNRFGQCVQELHKNLLREASINPEARGMATTLTIACVWANHLVIGHIGDSRAYLVRRGRIERLTQDHTLAEDLIRTGISAVTANRMRHVLTNCLGCDEGQVRVDLRELRLEAGDQVLVCTDGLTDQISDAELMGVLLQSESATSACDALIRLALERGGRDNVTVIVGRCIERAAP